MTAPGPDIRRVGRRLLDRELDGGVEPDAIAEVAERAAGKLGQHLSRLIGAAGYYALLKRALHLAGREHAFLVPVQPTPTADGGLDGLRAAIQVVDPERARAALVELFSQLVGLLVTFIGQDLTLRTLRQAWPDLVLDQGDSDHQEDTV